MEKTPPEQVFTFTLWKDETYGVIAYIQPDDRGDIQRKLRAAVFDDCIIGGWTIIGVHGLKETADYLISHGIVFDEKRQDKLWLAEIKGETAAPAPAAPRKNPPVCPIP